MNNLWSLVPQIPKMDIIIGTDCNQLALEKQITAKKKIIRYEICELDWIQSGLPRWSQKWSAKQQTRLYDVDLYLHQVFPDFKIFL